LRRISRESESILHAAEAVNEAENVAPWLLREWEKAWGEEATEGIIRSAMSETPRCLTVRVGEQNRADHIENVMSAFENAHILPQGSICIDEPPPGAVSAWPLFEEGAWWLQDVSATIPAIGLYESLKDEHGSVSGLHVVDMCAAPGGKTAQLCNYGFKVTAIEKSERRSKRLRENRNRLQMDWDLVVMDALDWTPSTDSTIDGMLLDVPCTATGTCSKRPDVLRKAESYDELLGAQYLLACHAADILKIGGILVYATCSLLKQESEDQVTKLLNRDAFVKLEVVPFQPKEIPGFEEAIDDNGWVRVLPGSPKLDERMRQCDGFFVARLRRIA
jgi:16S rRNA (cytosine967-C5)-methyltransferase